MNLDQYPTPLSDAASRLAFTSVGIGFSATSVDFSRDLERKLAAAIGVVRELERWITEDSGCHTPKQRNAGRMALIQARAVLATIEPKEEK